MKEVFMDEAILGKALIIDTVLGASSVSTSARTSHVVPEQMLLYLSVPGVSGKSAEVRVYTFMTK